MVSSLVNRSLRILSDLKDLPKIFEKLSRIIIWRIFKRFNEWKTRSLSGKIFETLRILVNISEDPGVNCKDTKILKGCWQGSLKILMKILHRTREYPQGTLRMQENFTRGRYQGGYSKKFYTGRLRPEVQPLTLLYTFFFFQKRHPFRIPFIGKRHPFHIPS